MSSRLTPQVLAKTLAYAAVRAPGEYGLFWDPDGTMPWRDFHAALLDDPGLRAVREGTIRELTLLGMTLPFTLEGGLLRRAPGIAAPEYPCASPPPRLYFGAPRRQHRQIAAHGLSRPSNRAHAVLFEDRERALAVAKRRDPDGICIEVKAGAAHGAGVLFRDAGGGTWLVEAVAAEFLTLPVVREEELAKLAARRKSKVAPEAAAPTTPGSFMLDAGRLFGAPSPPPGAKKKGTRGATWKRDVRGDRDKRRV